MLRRSDSMPVASNLAGARCRPTCQAELRQGRNRVGCFLCDRTKCRDTHSYLLLAAFLLVLGIVVRPRSSPNGMVSGGSSRSEKY